LTYAGHPPPFVRRFVVLATVALVVTWLALVPSADIVRHSFRISESAFTNATLALQHARPRRVDVTARSEALAPTGELLDFEPWELPFYRASLQELLDFDEEDLAKNRAGDVTFSQYPLGRLVLALGFSGSFALMGLVGLREAWSPSTPKYRIGKVKPADTRGDRIFMGLIGSTLLAVGLGLFFFHRGVFQDAVVMRACQISGPLEFHITSWKSQSITWNFTINGTKVTLPRRTSEGSKLIRQGAPYRLHYLCHSRVLVSLEPFVPTENPKGLPL
jgi:hypothetical protein